MRDNFQPGCDNTPRFLFVSPARIELALQAPQACVLSIKLRGQYGQLTLKVPKNPLPVQQILDCAYQSLRVLQVFHIPQLDLHQQEE